MQRVETTMELNSNGLNCSQAILTAFGEPYGLGPQTAKTMARPLGAGMGAQSLTCGALTSAALVLGLAKDHQEEKQARKDVYAQVRELFKRFEAIHGTSVCAELLGADMSTPEGMKRVLEEKLVPKHCPAFVRSAASILAELVPLPEGAADCEKCRM